jgi:hypothetical protein
MLSTELLLYIVLTIFIVYFAMTYFKDEKKTQIKYKYIPVDSDSDNKKSQRRSDENGYNRMGGYGGYPIETLSSVGGGMPLTSLPPTSLPPAGGPIPPVGPSPVGGPVPPIGVDLLRKFDYDSIHDEFTPPFRRSYYDDYNYRLHPGIAPMYTRGPMGRFRKVGTLIAQGTTSDDTYKFLHLMGREKHPGRDYEYYATFPNVENKLKFYIDTKGKEITDGDIVTVEELENYTYKFKEDPDLSPRYDPYIL